MQRVNLSISSFSLHFLILSPFPLHFLILSPCSNIPDARMQQVVQTWRHLIKALTASFPKVNVYQLDFEIFVKIVDKGRGGVIRAIIAQNTIIFSREDVPVKANKKVTMANILNSCVVFSKVHCGNKPWSILIFYKCKFPTLCVCVLAILVFVVPLC